MRQNEAQSDGIKIVNSLAQKTACYRLLVIVVYRMGNEATQARTRPTLV